MTSKREIEKRIGTLEDKSETSGAEPDFSLSEETKEWLDEQSPDLSDPDVRDEIERRAAEIEARGSQSSESGPHTLTAKEKVVLDATFGPSNDETTSGRRSAR